MILEYQCKNFKSIGDAITFSIVTSHDTELQENIIRINGKSFLKEDVIYGGNGIENSNFINSLSYLKQFITNSALIQPGQNIFTYPNVKMSDEAT